MGAQSEPAAGWRSPAIWTAVGAFVDRSNGGNVTIKWRKLGLFVFALAGAGYARTSRPDAPVATQPADVERPWGFPAGPR